MAWFNDNIPCKLIETKYFFLICIPFIFYLNFKSKAWSQIYVGYGFKHTEEFFFPKQPQKVLAEPEDVDEQPEVIIYINVKEVTIDLKYFFISQVNEVRGELILR